MSESGDNSNDRLEAGLRQWGAQQAVDQAGPKAAPDWVGQAARKQSPSGRPRAADKAERVGGTAMRWIALAATVVLLIGASAYITALVVGAKSPAQSAGLQVDVTALQRQLAKAQEDVARLSASLADAREKIAAAEADKAIIEKFPQLQKELAENQAARTTAEAKALELKLQLTGKDATIKATQDELARLKGQADELQKFHQQSENQLTVTKKRLAAAAEELAATDRARERTAEELRKAQTQITQLQAQQSSLAMDFQQLLSGLGETAGVAGVSPARAAGPAATPVRPTSLAARQDAMRRARMLGRLAEIRPQVTHENTLRLLDRLEVVLTKLDLLNTADGSAARQFAMLVRQGNFPAAIDEALAVPQTPQVRAWLLQAKLLLPEVDNVG